MSEWQGFVRWAKPDEPWRMRHPVVDGYRVAIVDELQRENSGWIVDDQNRKCRWTVGPGHVICKRPAVVALYRGKTGAWGYCEQHPYGRQWTGVSLLSSALLPVGGPGE